jgi:antitoxin component of MazEF toxin-antitoxin module
MARPAVGEEHIRKLQNTGGGTYTVSIPIHMIKKLKWRQGQKVEFALEGEKLVLKDWKK